MENYSKQREEIIKIIENLYNYPTAEEIYFLAKQKDPAISRSTVYRNLNSFLKKGIVTRIAISNGPDRFEYTENRKKHGYAFCTKCRKISEFDYDFENMKKDILGQTGIEIFHDGMVVKGICDSCKEAQK